MKVVTSVFAVMAIVLGTMVSSSYAQVTALFEDFEDSAATYGLYAANGTGSPTQIFVDPTQINFIGDFDPVIAGGSATSGASDFSSDYEDYFGRVDDYFGRNPVDGILVGLTDPALEMPPEPLDRPFIEFTNVQGNGFFTAQDNDSIPVALEMDTAVARAYVLWDDINIAGVTDLQFSALFAEDDATNSDGTQTEEDWNGNGEVFVEVRFDSALAFDDPAGPWTRIFAIQSASTGNDTEPRVDTNGDGIGDGAEITDVFTTYGAAISGTGSTLDLRIVISGLDAGDEDIAFDNVTISGVPEPSSLVLGMFALSALFMRRRVG